MNRWHDTPVRLYGATIDMLLVLKHNEPDEDEQRSIGSNLIRLNDYLAGWLDCRAAMTGARAKTEGWQ